MNDALQSQTITVNVVSSEAREKDEAIRGNNPNKDAKKLAHALINAACFGVFMNSVLLIGGLGLGYLFCLKKTKEAIESLDECVNALREPRYNEQPQSDAVDHNSSLSPRVAQ